MSIVSELMERAIESLLQMNFWHEYLRFWSCMQAADSGSFLQGLVDSKCCQGEDIMLMKRV